MLFRKLKFTNAIHPQVKDTEKWYLIIRTPQELLDFLEIDSKRIVESFLSIPANYGKNHLTVEQSSLEIMLKSKAISLKEGQTIDPVKFLCDQLDRKGQSMFKILEMGREILVQEIGSYCDYKGFMEIYNQPIIISELEKKNCFFPIDKIHNEIDLLFLENDNDVPLKFSEEVLDIVKPESHYKLTNLKFQDPDVVREFVTKSKVIAIETQLADKLQVERMLLLLSSIARKTIFLKSSYISELDEYYLFKKCLSIHDVRILNEK